MRDRFDEQLMLLNKKMTEMGALCEEVIALTAKEFDLLTLFLSHPGTAYTRDRLFSEVWGSDLIGESRTVDMHIRTLRQKLGHYGELIETVRGVGYRLEVPK